MSASDPSHAGLTVVHIITRWLNGGAEDNTLGSLRDQRRRGFRVALIHGREFAPDVAHEAARYAQVIEVESLVREIHPLLDARALGDIVRVLRRLRPDVVHTHESKAGVLGRIGARIARVPSVVHTVHIAPFLNVGPAARVLYVAAERAVVPATDAFIDVSEGMRDACLAHGIGRPRDHRVIRSGMDIAAFRAATAPDDWRARVGGWPHAEKPRIILFAGAFEPRKRQREFITALEPVLRGRTDVCVVFAGAGPLLEECRALANQLGLRQLRFVGHDPRLQELIALADVCVLTSEREGMPRVVVQYVAGGRPVVVTHLPGIEEVVEHGRSGLIVRGKHAVADAAAAALRLCDDESTRSRLAIGARETDVSAWEQDRIGDALADVYVAALGRRGRAGLIRSAVSD